MKILVTGGVRSGKSTHAESLLAGEPTVTYVAPGPTRRGGRRTPTGPRGSPRTALAGRRGWRTVETRDLAAALDGAPDAVLVDCLGTWLAAVIDDGVGLGPAEPTGSASWSRRGSTR